MIHIAAGEIKRGILNAKFLYAALLVILAFLMNGFVYADRYSKEMKDWHETVAKVHADLQTNSNDLQRLAITDQRMAAPFSRLAFVADDGAIPMPNSFRVNTFYVSSLERLSRTNEQITILPAIDWAFIVGTLMTLLAVLISYDAVCGEKRDGTLRALLSNPVSRLKLFMGKYLGLLAILLTTLIVGAAVSIATLVLAGALSLNIQVITAIGWALILSGLCLSCVLLVSLAVSSIVFRPVVALVVLMIVWVVIVVAIPGVARLVGEKAVEVPNAFEIRSKNMEVYKEVWSNAPDGAGDYNGDVFAPNMIDRAAVYNLFNDRMQRIILDSYTRQIEQVRTIQTISWASPSKLLADSLQDLCNTGVYGFERLLELARRYKSQLYSFVVERDRIDPDTPHLIYHACEPGTFSSKPVNFSTIPKWDNLLEEADRQDDTSWPALQLLLLVALNLQMAIIAFIALSGYDPR